MKYRPTGPSPTTSTTRSADRPRPAIDQDTSFFWEGAKKGELLIQRCVSCGTLRHPPRPACAACRSLEWDTQRASGRGTVHSYVVHHHPQVPGFEPPYAVVLVELEEGTRLVSNLVGVDPSEVTIGMPVAMYLLFGALFGDHILDSGMHSSTQTRIGMAAYGICDRQSKS